MLTPHKDSWITPQLHAAAQHFTAQNTGQGTPQTLQQQAPRHIMPSPQVSRPSQIPPPRSFSTGSQRGISPSMSDSQSSSATFPTSVYPFPEAGSSAIEPIPKSANKPSKKDKPKKSKPSPVDEDEAKKTGQRKTGRACDACRTRKIRCEILAADTPMDNQQICATCKNNGLECTFFLPLSETRFKKRSLNNAENTIAKRRSKASPIENAGKRLGSQSPNYENMAGDSNRETSSRVQGPTSIPFLLHTSVPPIQNEAYHLRHHSSWEVLEEGNGFIRVNAPPSAPGYADADPADPSKAHNRLNKPVLSAQTMSLLVNAYFSEVAPLFPIVSRAEFANKSTPSPLLLYSICGLGATRRQFPKEIFTGVRGVINGILRSNDILSDARFENVQALLLLAQVGDLHAQPSAPTASASFIRTGAAIRMAQDLGLHRELSHRTESDQDQAFIELRRRVWSTCVIMDRWYGAALGVPLTIDLLDCDVLLPAPYEITPEKTPTSWPHLPTYMALTEHLKLAILMGRVLKAIYSPTGLKHTTDEELNGLFDDMVNWLEGLPEPLRFNGITTTPATGLLHLGFAAVQFLFWRVFLRLEYECPAHLNFRLHVPQWTKVTRWSREALQWLDANDGVLDTVFIYPYAATSCALIQYHTWARRGDPEALESLRTVKEMATRWEEIVQPDQMSIRRKTCETMTLLYEAALKTNPSGRDSFARPSGNPTAGVTTRKELSKLVFVKDPSRPGGGFYVAQDEKERNISGLTQNDVVVVNQSFQGGQNIPDNVLAVQAAPPNAPPTPVYSDGQGPHQVPPPHVQHPTPPNQPLHPPLAHTHMNALGQALSTQGAQRGIDGILQSMQNVNPQLRSGDIGEMSQITNITAAEQGTSVLDPSFLDSLPLSSFDWDSWSMYFDRFLPNTNNSAENMQ